MQEDKIFKEQIKNEDSTSLTNFICVCSHSIQLICISSKCKNSALVCGQTQCHQLKLKHKKCTFITPDQFIQKIMAKRKEPPNRIKQTVNQLLKIYDQAIDKLSKDRQSITVWQQNFGLSPDDYKFTQLIKRNRVDLVKGRLTKSVFGKLTEQQSNSQYFTPKYVEQLWKEQRVVFDRVFQKFNIIFRGFNDNDIEREQVISKNDEQQKQFIAMARSKRWQQILRDFQKYKTLKNLTYLDLGARSIFHIPIISFMPNVTKLWLNNNNITKIENLSENFPLLQFLSLKTNEIKKIENLQGLTLLQQLFLQKNQIQEIQNLQTLNKLTFVGLSGNPLAKNVNKEVDLSQMRRLEQLKKKGVKVEADQLWYLII